MSALLSPKPSRSVTLELTDALHFAPVFQANVNSANVQLRESHGFPIQMQAGAPRQRDCKVICDTHPS